MTIAVLLLACTVDWGAHDAWKQCKPAIAKGPGRAAPPCTALRMCANEAPLTVDERAKLGEMIRDAGCEEP